MYRWTVLFSQEQAHRLRRIPWVMVPRQLGLMYQHGENLEFRDPAGEETWSAPVQSLLH